MHYLINKKYLEKCAYFLIVLPPLANSVTLLTINTDLRQVCLTHPF